MLKATHYVQIGLAAVAAMCGAAVPLLVSPMTPTSWLVLVGAEALALKGVLSVKSETDGDKQSGPANTNGGGK